MPNTQVTMEVGDEDVVAQRYDERCPIHSIGPHPLNPNHGDVAFIQESIRQNGWFGAVLVQDQGDGTGRIIAGEHRWRAAIEEGRQTVPVFWKQCTDAEAIRIMLVDNESARRAKIQADALEQCLVTLQEIDPDETFAGTGYSLRTLERIEEDRHLLEATHTDFVDRYGIILECADEDEQRHVFETLTEMGFENLRVIAV